MAASGRHETEWQRCTSGMMRDDDGGAAGGKSGMSTRLWEPHGLLSCFVGVGGAAVELQQGSRAQREMDRALIGAAGALARDDEWRQVGDGGRAVAMSGYVKAFLWVFFSPCSRFRVLGERG
ncbi:hypothetical protein NL676_028872 [Syzygium grande]|nr:hypothetical protein NL676_028872 [Syzygium grande]